MTLTTLLMIALVPVSLIVAIVWAIRRWVVHR